MASSKPYRDRVEVLAFDQDGRIFAGRFGDGSYGFIGGGTDGESATEAARREFLEETGYTLTQAHMVNVPPIEVEWETAPKSDKMRRRMKKYRGTRTYFVYGEVDPAIKRTAVDDDAPMTLLKFHPCAHVRKHLTGGASPEQSQRRREALDACKQKVACLSDADVILGDPKLATRWPRYRVRGQNRFSEEWSTNRLKTSPSFEPLMEWRGEPTMRKAATLTFNPRSPQGRTFQQAASAVPSVNAQELRAKIRSRPGFGSVAPQPSPPPAPVPSGPALRASTPEMAHVMEAVGKGPGVPQAELLRYARAAQRRPDTATMQPMPEPAMPDRRYRALTKSAAVNPLIQTTPMEPEPDGQEVHAPLNRNPYLNPLQPPEDAPEYENGYQFAQQLGHQALGQVSEENISSWAQRPDPWRQGFAEGARRLGAGRVADMLEAATGGGKMAMATWNYKGAAVAAPPASAATAPKKSPPVYALNPMAGTMAHVSGQNAHGTSGLASQKKQPRTSNVYSPDSKGQLKLQSWDWQKVAGLATRARLGGMLGAALPLAAGVGAGMLGGDAMAGLLPGDGGGMALPMAGGAAGGLASAPLAIPGAAMGTALGLQSGIRNALRSPQPADQQLPSDDESTPSPAMPAPRAL